MAKLVTGLAAGILLGALLVLVFFPRPAAVPPVPEIAPPPPPPLRNLPVEEQPSLPNTSPRTAPENNAHELNQLKEENQVLKKQVADLLDWINDNLPRKGEEPAPSLVKENDPPLLDHRGNFDPNLARELNLDPSQVSQVEAFMQRTAEDLNAYRTNRVAMYQHDPGQMFLRIPAFPEEGRSLRNDLIDNLRSVMDMATFTRFMEAASERFNRSFHYFGEARQSLSFKSYTDPDTGEPMIRVVDRYHVEQGNGRKTIEVEQGSYRDLPESYAGLVEWDL